MSYTFAVEERMCAALSAIQTEGNYRGSELQIGKGAIAEVVLHQLLLRLVRVAGTAGVYNAPRIMTKNMWSCKRIDVMTLFWRVSSG